MATKTPRPKATGEPFAAQPDPQDEGSAPGRELHEAHGPNPFARPGAHESQSDEERAIRERAYELWERAGSPEHRAWEFWLEAERQLQEETAP